MWVLDACSHVSFRPHRPQPAPGSGLGLPGMSWGCSGEKALACGAFPKLPAWHLAAQLPAQTLKWPCWLRLSGSSLVDGPLPPPAWARCALSGQRLPLDSRFLSRLLSEQAHVAAATTTVPAQRPWGRGRMISRLFPCQSQTLPPPRALVTGAIVLPWPRPPQLFQAICSSASHLLSLFKAVRRRRQDGGEPGAGSLEGALLLSKGFPKPEHRLSSPCSAPPLPGVPDLGSLDSAQWVLQAGSIQ